jgi:hypothetical protein
MCLTVWGWLNGLVAVSVAVGFGKLAIWCNLLQRWILGLFVEIEALPDELLSARPDASERQNSLIIRRSLVRIQAGPPLVFNELAPWRAPTGASRR